MTAIRLIVKEIGCRKINFLLSLFAVATAAALFVCFFTAGEASINETTRLMRDIGYNLRIIRQDTDINDFWTKGYSTLTMPEDYARRLANTKIQNLLYTHLLATLQERIEWRGKEAILKGIAAEVMPPGAKKPPMIFSIQPGTAYVGHELAKALEIAKGDDIEILGGSFKVERCLFESGTEDDIRIYVHLTDAQKLLRKEGLINEIQALDCKCIIPNVDPLTVLREQLSQSLPDAKVIQISHIAKARTEQREMTDKYFALIMPLAAIVCAIWIGALAMLNVRERRREIGVLRALGYGSGRIAFLFLGKAALIGLIGAAIGFVIGTGLALKAGPQIFKVTAKNIAPIYSLLYWSLLAAPLFAAVSSFIPAAVAVTQDPADVLREE
ncbi:MAG: FtsX-like permease family protein [Candidatus Omnitrophota bacterium]